MNKMAKIMYPPPSKYKKDILVCKRGIEPIWMDYEKNSFFTETCWIDLLPFEAQEVVISYLYQDKYNYIHRPLNMDPHFNTRNGFANGGNKGQWRQSKHFYHKMSFCDQHTGAMINRMTLLNGRAGQDYNSHPCPGIQRAFNRFVDRYNNKFNEDGKMAGALPHWIINWYRPSFTDCKCKSKHSSHPYVMKLFNLLYEQNVSLDEFVKRVDLNIGQLENVDYNKYYKNDPYTWMELATKKSKITSNIINSSVVWSGYKYFNSVVWNIYHKELHPTDDKEVWIKPICKGFNAKKIPCKCMSAKLTYQINVNNINPDYLGIRKIWSMINLRHEVGEIDKEFVYLPMCGKCSKKYVKPEFEDPKFNGIPVKIVGNTTDGLLFDLDKLIDDNGYKLQNGYLITSPINWRIAVEEYRTHGKKTSSKMPPFNFYGHPGVLKGCRKIDR